MIKVDLTLAGSGQNLAFMAFLGKTFPVAVGFACVILASALAAAEPALAPEVQHRLDLLKTGYETFVLNTTTIPYEDGVKALNAKVKPTLERESAAAAQRTDLDTLVRIKADLERLGEGQVLTAVEEAPPAPLKHTYAAYKLELSRLESIQKASLADAKRRYDKGLEQVQKELTKAQEVAAALEVKQLREALAESPAPTSAEATGKVNPATGDNLLANGSFEKGTGRWEMTTWNREVESKMVMDKKVLFHDKATLRVTNPALNDTHIAQKVKVKPGTRYLMSGFIKTQDIKDAKGNTGGIPGVKVQGGGGLSVSGKERSATSFVITDTWTEVSREFKTQDETEVVFECRLGYYSGPVTGTAWFADISLTEVKEATTPQGAVPQYWTYHMKATDPTSQASIELKPDGQFIIGNDAPGRWEQSKTSGVITISQTDKPSWRMTLNGDGTAMLDRPEAGRRYLRVRE